MSTTDKIDAYDKDPVMRRMVIGAVVGFLLTQAAKLGLDLDDAQRRNITDVAQLVVPLIAAWWAQRSAFSPDTVRKMMAVAFRRAPNQPEAQARRAVAHPVQVGARRDPGWLRRWWPVWAAVAGLAFAGAEAFAIVAPGDGGTLSEWTRDSLGMNEGQATAGWWALTGLLTAFTVWYPIHLRRGWPWERDDRAAVVAAQTPGGV